MKAPREDLIRSNPMAFAQTEFLRADTDTGDGRTMTGYPVVFNQWTEINSLWEGHFLERAHPGSLNRTLEQRGDKIQVLFNHGFDPSIGDKPLGKPDVQDIRDYGLWTEVPLSRTSYNDDLIELMRDGALWGQSYRFTVLDERWVDEPEPSDHNPRGLPERTIMESRLYEYGPVTFPAYEATTLGLRSADAYQEWMRNRRSSDDFVPDVSGWSLSNDVETLATVGTVTSSPIVVPAKRQLHLSAPRRHTVLANLTEFLERTP